MLTEKDYCDYETCVALREVGCRIETEWYIHQPSYERGSCYLCFGISREASVLDECDYIPRLSLYEAQKWLREEKGIVVDVSFSPFGYFASMYTNVRNVESEILKERFKFEWSEKLYGEEEHDSYEEALSEGIKEAVKILK